MAGLFSLFDYMKPGRGVPKDPPPKHKVLLFIEILIRKFWNIVRVNLLFTVFNIPALVIAFFLTNILSISTGYIVVDIVFRLAAASVFIALPLITTGPAQAGMTYVLRNYSMERHAFILLDFKEHALSNLKQSLAICAIDIIAFVAMFVSLNFYWDMISVSILYTAGFGLSALVFIIFLMMHLFIYPMLVSFKLTVKQIYKNALIFAILKFFPNLLILALCASLTLVTFANPLFGALLFILITNSLIGFVINFYANPVIVKYMDRGENGS